LTAEQKAKKAMADAVFNRHSRLTIDRKAEKVRINTERQNVESSQDAVG
jgi:ATP-dependent protease Clp ATPase subunit